MELESILLPGIEAKRPIVIAGPCSAETEEQVMETAKQLAAKDKRYTVPVSGNRVPNREVSKESVWKDLPG